MIFSLAQIRTQNERRKIKTNLCIFAVVQFVVSNKTKGKCLNPYYSVVIFFKALSALK